MEALEERSLLAATVGIETTDSTAGETPAGSTDYATFVITRSGETDYSQPLTVYFQTSGTAGSPNDSSGAADYQLYNSNGYSIYQTSYYDDGNYIYCYSVTIPANVASTNVELRPTNDATREDAETVNFTATCKLSI